MLNLEISNQESCSLKNFILVDESDYDNVRIRNVSMEITPPNFPKINVTFVEKQVNIYNAHSLNINCDRDSNLPDGIYEVKYSIFPNADNFIQKKFFRLEILKCKYGKVLLSLHLQDCCTDLHNKLRQTNEVWQLIVGVSAAANDCDFHTAKDLYNKACKILDSLNHDCNC